MEALELEGDLLPVGTTPVHIAVNSGQVGALRSLLDRDRSLVDQPDHFGHSPLARALQNGRLEAAQLLIEHGADLDTPYGTDPQQTLAQVLISDSDFASLLHCVVEAHTAPHLDLSPVLPPLAHEGNVDMLEAVLSRQCVDVDCRDNLQCTALHYASSRGLLKVVRLLLVHGANRHLKTSFGSTALHLACSAGHLEVVAAILAEDLGSETPQDLLNSSNRAGDVPIVCAFRNEQVAVVQYLLTTHLEHLDLGRLIPSGHRLPGLCFFFNYWTSHCLLRSPFHSSSLPCLSTEESQWLLHASIHADSPEGVRDAVTCGASVECLDYMLQTPLMLAAKLGSVDMCRCLVERGADPNVADVSGKTALVHAFEHGRSGVVEYLLSQPTCCGLDPHSLTSPIATPDMLAVLVSYFEGRREARSVAGGDWVAWLALAGPTAPTNLFQALVRAVAPEDWVQQMCSGTCSSGVDTTKSSVFPRVATHPTLPAYAQEEIVGDSHKPRPKLVRSFSRPRKWNFARAPPSTSKEWKFKHIPQPRKPPAPLAQKGVPFSLSRARFRPGAGSVIHSAALHNLDVLRFILASCEEPSLQEKVLLSRDEAGRTALELALSQFDVISDCCSSLELRDTTGLDEYLKQKFPLPESLLFEEALLHYLCVGKHIILSKYVRDYQSPLQAWPLWYLQLQVNAFCLNNETGLLQLSELKDRMELLHTLLDHKYLSTCWNEGVRQFPSPLFAAVQHSNSWAVGPLLSHGADPTTHHRGRLAVEVAARHGQVQTVEEILGNGLEPFLALPGHLQQQLFSSLSSTLGHLVRSGLIGGAVNLLQGLNLGQYLWPSHHASSFLFSVQTRCDGSELYESVLSDLVSFIGTRILNWEGERPQATAAVLRSLRSIRRRCSFQREKVSEGTRNLLTLLDHALDYGPNSPAQEKFGELFHSFCGHGNYHVIRFVVERSCSDIAGRIINKSDSQGLSPLFHAACGGHLDIVRFLLDCGAVVHSTGLSPVVGALSYLAPRNMRKCSPGNVSFSAYTLKIYRDCMNLLPRHSSSRLSEDSAGAAELVRILLPSPSEWVLAHLLAFPAPFNSMHAFLLLISAVRDSSALVPLLERILNEPLPLPPAAASPIADQKDTSHMSVFEASPIADQKDTSHMSVFEAALYLAPTVSMGSRGSQLFESFLLKYLPDGEKLTAAGIFTAARKGYWDIVEAVLSANKLLVLHGYEYDFVRICLLAVKVGKRDLLCRLLQSGVLSLSKWWPKLALAAVRADRPDVVNVLISAGCHFSICLRAAARLGSHKALGAVLDSQSAAEVAEYFSETVTLAAQRNQPSTVNSLLDFYQSHTEITIDSQCSRDAAFWLQVLAGSASHGHQSLALHAVSCTSESEMRSTISQHVLYRSVIYRACYWGLTDLLACLPYHEGVLLEREGQRESPLEAAIANGRLGCIPLPPSQFPLCSDFHSWFEGSHLNPLKSCDSAFYLLVTGLFHHILSATPSTAVQEYRSLEGKKKNLLLRPNGFQLFQDFTGSFCAPLLVYAMRSGSLDLPYAAALEPDSGLLDQILRVLFSSGYMAECFEQSRVGSVHDVAQYGHVSSLDLFLHCGEVFTKRLRDQNDEGQNVLHSAVMSQGYSVDKLDLLLGRLGDQAPDMCLTLDKHGHSPIQLSFCRGRHERADRLLQEAVKSSSFDTERNPAVVELVEEARRAQSWFRVMMELGRSSSEGHCMIFNIRDCSDFETVKFFEFTNYKDNHEVLYALLVASCGWIIHDVSLMATGLWNSAVLRFLGNCPSYILPLPDPGHPDELITFFKYKDISEEVVCLMKLIDSGKLQVSLDLKRLFLDSCVCSRPPVVKHLLSRNPSLSPEALLEGMENGFAFGGLEIAAEILLSTESNWSPTADLISGLSPVVKHIFLAPRDYQTIVEDLFESLGHSEKAGRLCFSEQWLAHQWRPYQKQLVEKADRLPEDPPNPWMMGLNWRDKPLSIQVTVDWKSFRDCLLEPPLPLKQQSTPLLVEAVVFSSSVLGQLCPATEVGGHSTFNLADFFEHPQPPESLVVSCVKWPLPPSSELASPNKGLLCLSYKPREKAFVFPAMQPRSGLGDESYSTDSGMHSLCLTDTSVDTKDDECNTSIFADRFKELCKFHQRKLRCKHQTGTDIAVEGVGFDPFVLQSVFQLCSEAIALSSSCTTAYARISRASWVLPAPPPKHLFSHIGINVDSAAEGDSSSAVVSLVDSGLDFSLVLASDTSVSPPWTQLLSHEALLQQTVDCTLHREVQVLRERLGRFVGMRFLPCARQVVRSELALDSVHVLLESPSGDTTLLSLARVEHLLALKAIKHIKTFLVSLCDVLRAFSQKPRVFSSIRSWLQRGLSIVISEARDGGTSITASPAGLRLTVHTRDLHHPHRQRALVSLVDSLFGLSQENVSDTRDQDVKVLFGEVPCPFLTRVDLAASVSFLYPVVGLATKLFVQVVGYGGQSLTLPLKYNCFLRVAIGSPCGKSLSASSSEEPSAAHGASADLFVTTSEDGRFEMVWTPTEEGPHSIHLTLNGIKIHETFRKVNVEKAKSCSGKGLISAGDHLVFVAAHVGCSCPFTSQKSRVVLTRDTVIEPSPLLKDIPGYATFTTSSSFSALSTARPSDQLKEAVSSMTGLQDSSLQPPLPLLHHLSVSAAHGGSREWSHTPTGRVTVHISCQEKKNTCQRKQKQASKPSRVKRRATKKSKPRQKPDNRIWQNPTCVSLGHGMYRVSLQSRRAGTYKVFASCPLCQSVMKIHWLEGQTFYPQPFYVVPGPFSASSSTVTDASSGRHVKHHHGYHPGRHRFHFNSRDAYGNPHTVRGAIKSAVVLGAGPLDVGPEPSLEEVQVSGRLDSSCEVTYEGHGRYLLTCSLVGAGLHSLVVETGQLGRPEWVKLTGVSVCGDPNVHPQHCWLDPSNVYNGELNEPHNCYIYLYDQYFNPYNDGQGLSVTVFLDTRIHFATLCSTSTKNRYMFQFTPNIFSNASLRVLIDNEYIADPLKTFTVLQRESFQERLAHFRNQVARHALFSIRALVRVDRSRILEAALANRQTLRQTMIFVRFEGESGIDAGGVSSEFFQLLNQELVNPRYALFYSTNGLHRPSPHSFVNPAHLFYFTLCGEVMARMLCDNYLMSVRFTPAVYKFMLGEMCTLNDLKAEDPTLHEGLMEVARCKSEKCLEQLVTNFTTTLSRFGSLETVELERGGQQRRVTLRNRDLFISKFCQWHLIDCINIQLLAMREGFRSTIPVLAKKQAERFHWQELETLLCGQPVIDVSFIKSRASYEGYSASSREVVWLWQVLETLSQEELTLFLQFTTGSGNLPVADSGQWKLKISRGSLDESLLPTAATCFKTLSLPRYTSQAKLQQKLMQAISYGHLHFCNH